MKEELTFEDGVIICKHIYQSAIDKTLKGVMEQEEILYRAYKQLHKLEKNFDNKRLDELLHLLNIEDIYTTI
jgi:hypothetical protein